MKPQKILTQIWSGNIFPSLYDNMRLRSYNQHFTTIAGWNREQRSLLLDELPIIDLISENTNFYQNESRQAVVGIGKCEAAVVQQGS